MKKNGFLWITLAYFLFNIFNTYFLTTSTFNQYIITFKHTFSSELFSFIGNFAILGILYLTGILILRKEKRITIYLIVISFILNVVVIALQYYSKNYKLAFSFFNFSLLKSPTGGFGGNVALDWIYELFIYYRIICLLPFILILTLFIVFRKEFLSNNIKISLKKILCSFAILITMSVTSYQYYQYSLHKNWGYSTEYAQYGCQYAGTYNYYIYEVVFRVDNRNISSKTIPLSSLDEYNKNKNSYINYIDKKTYSNKDNQTGILKGKNLFVIQMESTMSFCYNATFNGIEITPNFNKLFKDKNCFYFDNVHTTVGIGNTSDAEFAFFTGFYPTGDMTVAWEYDTNPFKMTTLGDHFNSYQTYSYNGTNENFYNHNNLHEGLFKINDFRGLETYESIYPKNKYKDKYLRYWISDSSILEWAAETAKDEHNKSKNSFSFVETITPHNPFYDLSDSLPNFTISDFNLGSTYYQLENYLNQVKYNDTLLYNFLMNATNPNSETYLKDTIFILYGDHGNALSKGAYESLYNRELTDLEYHNLLLKIPVIIYEPTPTGETGEIYKSLENKEAVQSQIKSNIDLYRTIINLFGIETEAPYFGVNMFSGEPTFSYDPKNSNIITDDFIYNEKNKTYELFTKKPLNKDLIKYVLNYRKKQDNYLNSLIYK